MPAAFGNVGLHEKDVAAHGSPRQTDNDAGVLHALFYLLFQAVLRAAEQFGDNVRGDGKLRVLSLQRSSRMLPANAGNLPFQVPDASFPRVVTGDAAQRLVFKLNLIGLQSAVFPGTGNEVVARDL